MRRAALLFVVSLAGCECQPPAVSPGPFRFDAPAFEPTLRGAVTRQTVTFFNDGDVALRLVGLEVTPHTAFSLIGDGGLDVPAHGTASVDVRFEPLQFGEHEASLRFLLAPGGQSVSARLRATCIGPSLSVEPTVLDLGTLSLATGGRVETSALLTVRNPGQGADLHVTFTVPGNANGELCLGDCQGGEVRVPADGLAQVPVHFLAFSAGPRRFDVRVTSDDSTRPEATVVVTANVVAQPACHVSVSPATLDFGTLTPAHARTLNARIENTGSDPCTVSSVDFAPEMPSRGAPVFALATPVSPVELAPGEALDLPVTAADPVSVPFLPGATDGVLQVALADAPAPATVGLHVTFDRPCVVTAPDALDFGTQLLGCAPSERVLTVYNLCATPVTVTGLSVPAPFSSPVQVPHVLSVGASLALPITWAPTSVGSSNTQLSVQWSRAGQLGSNEVSLMGNVVAVTGRDVFAPSQAKLDVLLVLDDSGSMQVVGDAVTAKLQALLPALDAEPIDYRVGVITGEVSLGVLHPTADGSRWLTSAQHDRAARFAEMSAFTYAWNFESQEQPLLRAITPTWSIDPARNAGFLRSDARLSVLSVADHGDTAVLLDDVLAVKRRGFLRWDVFSPTPATQCTALPPNPAPNGHTAYTGATGGAYTDLCVPSWAPAFANAATWAVRRDIFPLSGVVATPGTVSVEVSGVPVTSTTTQGATVWTWDTQTNQVRFAALFAPSSSDTVVVTYPAACAP